jgi:hypothetical protein
MIMGKTVKLEVIMASVPPKYKNLIPPIVWEKMPENITEEFVEQSGFLPFIEQEMPNWRDWFKEDAEEPKITESTKNVDTTQAAEAVKQTIDMVLDSEPEKQYQKDIIDVKTDRLVSEETQAQVPKPKVSKKPIDRFAPMGWYQDINDRLSVLEGKRSK